MSVRLEAHDIERILRDVLDAQGLGIAVVRATRGPNGWRVDMRDLGDRPLSVEIADGPAAAVRAAFTRWANAQD